MAGYGNRTGPDYTADSLTDEHSSTRLGLTDSCSAPTYGAGFGNKRTSLTPTTEEKSVDEEDIHFNTQDRHGSAPYSNAHKYGSGSTAGAGYGNKTGSFSSEGEGEQKHSTVSKVMQRIGGIVHGPGLTKKGKAKGADAPNEGGQHPNVPTAN